MKALLIHPEDNVAVMVEDTAAGQPVQVTGGGEIKANRDIRKGHKIAVKPIRQGEAITKYSRAIGRATADIAVGDWAHTHNIQDTTEEICDDYAREYRAAGTAPPPKGVASKAYGRTTFMGYPRADGRVGIRNYVLVLSLIQCSNSVAHKVATACGVPAITIETGCGEFADQEARTNLGLIRAGQHPNVYGVLLLTLGCQWTDEGHIGGEIAKGGARVRHLCIQREGGYARTVEKGIGLVRQMQAEAAAVQRAECPVSGLVVGNYCGGSDWTSSLAANPVAGEATDILVANGGATMTCGVRGAPGGEGHLVDNAVSFAVGCQILDIVDEYRRDVLELTGQSIAEVNPTPGNKEGGITTLCEKAIGNMKLSGHAAIHGVLQMGDAAAGPGAWFLDNRQGGNDVYATTALAMGGCHLQLFTTGLGTPLGNAVSTTIKITGNRDTDAVLGEEMVDYCGAPILEGTQTVEQAGRELYDLLLEVAEGRETKAEEMGDWSYTTPPWGKF